MKKVLSFLAAGIFLLFCQTTRLAAQAPEHEGHTPEAKAPDKCAAADTKE
ncbi:MAG: hypothetical protein WBG02_08930 [Candidatus Acidiferrum sp.]